jgi:hypothetical protein
MRPKGIGSIDYDPGADASQRFFATVQNKMHWAAHGQTAAEIVCRRADAAKENMGLIHWVGDKPSKGDLKNSHARPRRERKKHERPLFVMQTIFGVTA